MGAPRRRRWRARVSRHERARRPGLSRSSPGFGAGATERDERETPMPALSLMIRPTKNGWAVCLTNGEELVRYRGFYSKQLALRYLSRYARSMSTARRLPSWWRQLD